MHLLKYKRPNRKQMENRKALIVLFTKRNTVYSNTTDIVCVCVCLGGMGTTIKLIH